jgi:exonuclease III
VDTSAGLLRGRPYGGVALLWRKGAFQSVSVIQCNSVRLAAIKVVDATERSFMVFSTYMPTDSAENLVEFTQCLGEVSAIIDSCGIDSAYILGDFNSHPGELFCRELLDFCSDQQWRCVDIERLGTTSDTYTFVSEAHGCRRWLDHILVTESALHTVSNVKVHYDVYWSDHFPLEISCDISVIGPRAALATKETNKVVWGEREPSHINTYTMLCNDALRNVDFPAELAV